MSIWKQGVIPGQERRFALGIWLNYRKMSSPAYVPVAKARSGLRYKRNCFYVMQFNLGNLQSQYGRISVAPNFRLLMLMGKGTAADPDGLGSFQVQIYDTARRQVFTPLPITSGMICGNAQQPMILKNPYRFTGTTPIQARVQNRANSANGVYLVLYGVSD